LTEPTTHTALIKLEKQGIVERRTLAPNRRRQRTFLTKLGWDLQRELEPLAVEANEVALSGIPKSRRETLRKDLITVLENLLDDEIKSEARGLKVPATRANIFE